MAIARSAKLLQLLHVQFKNMSLRLGNHRCSEQGKSPTISRGGNGGQEVEGPSCGQLSLKDMKPANLGGQRNNPGFRKTFGTITSIVLSLASPCSKCKAMLFIGCLLWIKHCLGALHIAFLIHSNNCARSAPIPVFKDEEMKTNDKYTCQPRIGTWVYFTPKSMLFLGRLADPWNIVCSF